MKKFLSLLLVTLTIFGCLLLSTGCFKSEKPNLNLIQAEKNLKDLDYDVTTINFEDYTFNFALALFGNYYLEYGFITGISAEHTKYSDAIMIFEYETDEIAKTQYNFFIFTVIKNRISLYKKNINFYKSLIKNLKDELKNEEIVKMEDNIKTYTQELESLQKFEYGRSGKFFWIGTKNAIANTNI